MRPRAGDSLKILVVSPYFPPAWNAGGTATAIWNVARGLVRTGAQVRVVTTDAHAPAAVPQVRWEEEMEVRTSHVAGGARAARHGLAAGLLPEAWRGSGWADVAVVQGLWTFPALAASWCCRRYRVPYVLCARGTLQDISLAEKPLKKQIHLTLAGRFLLRRAAAIHFSSRREHDSSRGAGASAPALVLPNACELGDLVPREPSTLRGTYGVPPGGMLVGMVGRIHPRKGYDVLFPALARARSDVRLLLLGADLEGHAAMVRDLAARCGLADRVHLCGHLEGEALRRAYAALDLLVLPSHEESFGNVVVEALCQGTPALVSDRVPLGEWVQGHGLGRVVPRLTPEAWAAALDAWAAAPLPRDPHAARAHVAGSFGVETIGKRWARALEQVKRGRVPESGELEGHANDPAASFGSRGLDGLPPGV